MKWSPENAKKETEAKIMKVLVIKSPVRWNELLEYTELSSRTLKKALDRMQDNGIVNRKMSSGREYPPPVYYRLTQKGKRQVVAQLFAGLLVLRSFTSLTKY